MHWIDFTIVGAFMLGLLALGAWLSKRAGRSTDEFILAGRKMPWWLAGASLLRPGHHLLEHAEPFVRGPVEVRRLHRLTRRLPPVAERVHLDVHPAVARVGDGVQLPYQLRHIQPVAPPDPPGSRAVLGRSVILPENWARG